MVRVRQRAAAWMAATLMLVVGALAIPSPAQAHHTLRHAAGDDMLVGVTVTPELLTDPGTGQLIATEFSSLTPRFAMTWAAVHASPGNFDFGPADLTVSFAIQHDQHVYGQSLVWHQHTPAWVGNFSGSALDQLMQFHIQSVMGRYAGAVATWQVASEVVDDTGQLRDSLWLQGLGEGYVSQAFHHARQADPGATLCVEDYGIEGINAKSDAYYDFVQQLLQQGVPIDCVGFRSSFALGQIPGDMQQNLQRFAGLGLDVWITGLEIRINLPATAQSLQQQAAAYGEVFAICQAVSTCRGVTLAGLYPSQGWTSSPGGWGDALLWDANQQRKPAYYAVADQLAAGPPPVTCKRCR